MESWERADFKTVPDFGIRPRFDGENEEINTDDFFLGHGVQYVKTATLVTYNYYYKAVRI